MAGTDLTRVHEAFVTRSVRSKGVENGHATLDQFGFPTNHQAVPVLRAADTTTHTSIQIADTERIKECRVFRVFRETRVSSIDDHVIDVEQTTEFGDHRGGDLASGNHHPQQPGSRDRCHQLSEGPDIRHFRIAVEPGDVDSLGAQAGAHVPAHFAEADQSDVHGTTYRNSRFGCRRYL